MTKLNDDPIVFDVYEYKGSGQPAKRDGHGNLKAFALHTYYVHQGRVYIKPAIAKTWVSTRSEVFFGVDELLTNSFELVGQTS